MNKTIFKLLAIIFCLNLYPLVADNTKNSVEIRADAFLPSSKRLRKIYGDVGISYGAEVSQKFNRYIEGWVNFDWFSKHGRSIGFHDPTKVSIANLSLGIKLPYQLSQYFTIYAGIGPSFSVIWLKNRSARTHEDLSKFAFGGVLKAGLNCFITRHFFLDLFVDYVYQPVHFETIVDIGGLKTGAGLGFKF